MQNLINIVNPYMTFLDNEIITSTITLFLVLYASMFAPNLSENFVKIFDYGIVKLFLFLLIVLISKKNPTLAIIASVSVLISLMTLNKLKFNKETMDNVDMNSYLHNSPLSPLSNTITPPQVDIEHISGVEEGHMSYHRLSDESSEVSEVSGETSLVSNNQSMISNENVQDVLKLKQHYEETLGRQITENELKSVCSTYMDNCVGSMYNDSCGKRVNVDGYDQSKLSPVF